MPEGAIIMQGHSVRHSLGGTKTQTRRLVTAKNLRVRLSRRVTSDWYDTEIGRSGAIPRCAADPGVYRAGIGDTGAVYVYVGKEVKLGVKPGEFTWVSPYGEVGDIVRVRETWGYAVASDPADRVVVYREHCPDPPEWPSRRGPYADMVVWRSPIHMPKWASRLYLRLTDVDVRRLQTIDYADIRAEGMACPQHDFAGGFCASGCSALRNTWASAWDSINSTRGAWATNPLVWVLSYQCIRALEGGGGLLVE